VTAAVASAAAVRLGVLDVHGDIEQTVELAPLADRLGYTRYWIAEHPPQPSPLLVAGIVAGLTERIRVGTAGVLLHYYPPLRTAHDFQFLDRVFGGRIDAGFCPGIARSELAEPDRDGRDLSALIAAYDERAARLVRHLRNAPGAPDHDPTTAWSGRASSPIEIWSLGGARSGELAAALDLRFGYALLFRTSVDDPSAALRYRERCPHPYAVLAVAGVCAETDAAAEAIARAAPSPSFEARIVGSPARCRAALADLAARYAADEVVFADLCPPADRARCYELLASASS
jgi:alkanesulfonate monooxygenase SsuD/methylene tetrahydromethanopterin reductase-like flavin-dependent oxidoreductase (luciferase family)